MRSCVVTEILILALFAASLHFIMSIGGLVSFGHAAYFGIGAYACALLVTHTGVPMAGRPAGGTARGGRSGRRPVRLVLHPAVRRLPGDADTGLRPDPLVGRVPVGLDRRRQRHPRRVAARRGSGSKTGYYYCTLALVVRQPVPAAARDLLALRLCAARRPRLPAALGGHRHRRAPPAVGGVRAWPARPRVWPALCTRSTKAACFPPCLSIPQSVDALVMVLLGGLQTLSGPVVGAAAYHALQTEMMRAHRLLARDPGRVDHPAGGGLPAGDRRLHAPALRLRRLSACQTLLTIATNHESRITASRSVLASPSSLSKSFGGVQAVQRRLVRAGARAAAGADRAQWRGQVDLLQHAQRSAPPRQRQRRARRRATSPAIRRARSGSAASGARSR